VLSWTSIYKHFVGICNDFMSSGGSDDRCLKTTMGHLGEVCDIQYLPNEWSKVRISQTATWQALRYGILRSKSWRRELYVDRLFVVSYAAGDIYIYIYIYTVTLVCVLHATGKLSKKFNRYQQRRSGWKWKRQWRACNGVTLAYACCWQYRLIRLARGQTKTILVSN